MPQIAVGVGVAAIGSIGAQVASGIALTAALTSATTLFASASALAFGLLDKALAPSVKQTGLSTTVRQSAAFRQVIYGQRRVGGVFAYIDTKTGNKNVLNLVVMWAGHEIEAVEKIFMGGVAIWNSDDGTSKGTGRYKDHVNVFNRLGTDTQTSFKNLEGEVSNWGSKHRLRGIACSNIRLRYSAEVFPNGLTNISALIKGKKCYDPRTGSTTWTENPAICLRDYLTNGEYGVGLTASQISDTNITAMANLSDELISANGIFTSRYKITSVFDEGARHREVIELMLGTMNAQAVWTGGQFIVTGGAYTTPDVTLTEDDIVGPVEVITRRSVQDRWNRVNGRFTRRGTGGNAYVEKEYTPLVSDTYTEEDGGRELALEHNLIWTPNYIEARRIAKVKLLQSRQQIVARIPVSLKGFMAVAGGSLYLTLPRYGWTSKEFEVVDFEFFVDQGSRPGVILTIRETSAAIWSWATSDETEDPAGEPTNLPDAFEVDAPNITAGDVLSVVRQEAISILTAEVSSDDESAVRFELEAQKAGETTWRPMSGQGGGARFELANVEDGATYTIRGRAFNVLNVSSEYANVSHSVVGKLERPADVTDFRVDVVDGQALLSWSPVSDLDLSHYEIRFQPVTSGGVYSSAGVLVEKVARPANSVMVPALVGTYFIKAVDKIGKTSETAASKVTPVGQVGQFNIIDTISESPTFPGTKTDMVELYGGLSLATESTGTNFDSIADLDALSDNIDTVGSGDLLPIGYYEPDDEIDLGSKHTLTIDSEITFTRREEGADMDGFTELIDSYLVDWDDIGSSSSDDDISVSLQVRTTDDDPSGSPTWSDWSTFMTGEFTARAFQFRVVATTTSTVASPLITAITITGKMKDRAETASNVASGTGGKAISYADAFYATPAEIITPLNMTTGDYWAITSRSASGFTIEFFNAASMSKDINFNWRAEGYGRAA